MKNDFDLIDKLLFGCAVTVTILALLLLIPAVVQVWAKVLA
jgi:hypothetical protein